MDEVEKLNSFLADQYTPETLLIEAPKNIGISDNSAEKAKIQAQVEKEVSKYEIKGSDVKQSSTSTSSPYSKSYSSSSSSSGYSYGSSSHTKSTVEEVMDKFANIQKKACEEAEKEMRNETTRERYSVNPQLNMIRKKNKKNIFGKFGKVISKNHIKQALIIGSLLVVKTVTSFAQEEYKDIIKKARDKK